MGARSRAILRCAVVLLAACLVVDMATPYLPGAFRLAPSESIEATAGRTLATAAVATDRLPGRAETMALRAAAPSPRRVTAAVTPSRDIVGFRPHAAPAHPPHDSASATDDD
jgi:hypothetical protein